MFFYVGSTKKLGELIRDSSKTAGYQSDRENSNVISYNNKQMEKKFEKLQSNTKTREVLRKKPNTMYARSILKTAKTLMKEIRDDLNEWRGIPRSWIQNSML